MMKFDEVRRVWRTAMLLLLLIIIGVALRLPGYDGRDLWIDELWRVLLVLGNGSVSNYWNAPNLQTAITAPLYLALNNLLGWVSTSPWSLRLSSLIPGLASIAFAYFIARKAGAGFVWSAGAALLFTANAHFIQYSNEFKPYMFEVMVHLACMALWLDLLTSKSSRQRQWVVFTLTLLIAAFCAANIVFVLPAMALSLMDKVLTRERDKLKQFFASFFIVGCAVISLYFLIWSYASDKALRSYWADNFYDATRGGYLTFAGNQLLGMWKGAFSMVSSNFSMVSPSFSMVSSSDWMYVVSVLSLAGTLYACWKNRLLAVQPVRGLLIYGLVLILTVLVLNRMDLWPIGEIRPNLFLFAIIAAWWVVLLSAVLKARAQWLMAALVVVVVMVDVAGTTQRIFSIFLGPPVEQTGRVWAAFSTSAPAGKAIIEQCKENPVTVFLNPGMAAAYQYHTHFGDKSENANALMSHCATVKFVPDAYINAEDFRRKIAAGQQSSILQWHLYSHLNREEVGKLKAAAEEFGPIHSGESFVSAGYFSVIRGKAEK